MKTIKNEYVKKGLRICYYAIWVFVAAAILIAVPVIRGYYPVTIMEEETEPGYPWGSLTYYKKAETAQLAAGDVIVYRNGNGEIRLDSTAENDTEKECVYVQAEQGDENSQYEIAYSRVEGKAITFSIPLVGVLPDMISKWYVMALMGVILLLNIWMALSKTETDETADVWMAEPGKEEQYDRKEKRRKTAVKEKIVEEEEVTAADFFADF